MTDSKYFPEHPFRDAAWPRAEPVCPVKLGALFIDGDGDVCVHLPGDNLVFCPAVGDEGNVQHPEIIAEMVRLYNAALSAPTPPADVAGLVERLRIAYGGELSRNVSATLRALSAALENAVAEAHATGFERERWKARAEAAEAALADARDKALEEAAVRAASVANGAHPSEYADAIRAMKSKP